MRKIYIDSNFRCHLSDNGTLREIVLSENAELLFSGKCSTFIEGYRVKPDGEIWVREDGEVFSGDQMITPWKPYSILAAAQAQYEQDLADRAELEAAYNYLLTGGIA